jgi:Tyrosine-protein kinase ephrin type A/B receptor-like
MAYLQILKNMGFPLLLLYAHFILTMGQPPSPSQAPCIWRSECNGNVPVDVFNDTDPGDCPVWIINPGSGQGPPPGYGAWVYMNTPLTTDSGNHLCNTPWNYQTGAICIVLMSVNAAEATMQLIWEDTIIPDGCAQIPPPPVTNFFNMSSCEDRSAIDATQTTMQCSFGPQNPPFNQYIPHAPNNGWMQLTCPVPGMIGYFGNPQSCLPCSAGTYKESYDYFKPCTPCPPGTYSSTLGASSNATCILCPANTFNPYNGSFAPASCLPCPYPTEPGSSTCSPESFSLSASPNGISFSSSLTLSVSLSSSPLASISQSMNPSSTQSTSSSPSASIPFSSSSTSTFLPSKSSSPNVVSETSSISSSTSPSSSAEIIYSVSSSISPSHFPPPLPPPLGPAAVAAIAATIGCIVIAGGIFCWWRRHIHWNRQVHNKHVHDVDKLQVESEFLSHYRKLDTGQAINQPSAPSWNLIGSYDVDEDPIR